jgi:malate dehydrogenase
MTFIAIIGAGPLGGAVAHAIARRDRVAEVRLIDASGSVAAGKALDMLQSSPIENFSTRVTSADSISAAVGARAIVMADRASDGGEHAGDAGLALLRTLMASGAEAPVVCAGAGQRELIARAVTELRVPGARIVGSAPLALESALRALTGVALDRSGADVSLSLVGVPPRSAVVAWEEATAGGQPLSSQLPAHTIAQLSSKVSGLWPPGPYALGTAAARTSEALIHGSRRRFTCFVAMQSGPVRAAVTAMPVELREGGVARVLEPALTRQERTMLENALEI